jgi:hypothetical protein
MLIATSALAQIGVRTGKPTLDDKTVSQQDAENAGLMAVAADPDKTKTVDLADNQKNVRVKVDPANEGEPSGACVVAIGGFPTRKKDKDGKYTTSCFWNQKGQEYLKYARFINTSKTAGVAMDVLSDTIGPFRLVLSTAVAANTSDDDEPASDDGEGGGGAEGEDDDEPTSAEDQALNLLAANGGNLAITAALPLYFKPIGNGSFLWNSYARVAGNVQAFGSDGSTVNFGDTNANLELAFSEFQLDMLTDQENFNLLGYAKTSAVVGTKKFAEAIGDPSRAFLHGQLGAGVRIADMLNVYLTYNWYSDNKIPGDGASIAFSMGK